MTPRDFDRPIVVTGTGTNIGKTHLSRLILEHLRAQGFSPLGLKPVETGYVQGEGDAVAIATAAGHSLVPPYFTAPEAVSPHLAARTQNRRLQPADIAAWVLERTRARPGPCLVETAGGLFSPLSDDEAMLDLVRALDPCVFVLVAPDRLGVLHDVCASVYAARALYRAPDLVVLNVQQPNDLDNTKELNQLGLGLPVLRVAGAPDLALLSELLRVAASTTHRD